MDFEQFFHSYCNFTSGTYKGWWKGGAGWVVGEGGQQESGYTLCLGLVGVAMSPRRASHKQR